MIANLCLWVLKTWGFRVLGIENLLAHPKSIIIAAPHTSNWDFILGVLIRTAYKLTHIKYLGKSSLFKWPWGVIFRYLGGYPVERSKKSNLVDQVVHIFNKEKRFAIVIAPEGTRKKVEHFRTGFYYMAKGANVPIILCKFDWANRIVDFSTSFFPGTDAKQDITYIESFYVGIIGKDPKNSFGV